MTSIRTDDAAPPHSTDARLKKIAGPVLLWGLGVGYVISGDYYGWNYGLEATGYWGYLVAMIFATALYATLSAVIAELAAAIPHSGGPYAFARIALGPFGGFMTGAAVLMQYVISPVAVAISIGAYVQVLVPQIPIIASAAALYLLSSLIHLVGAGSSLKVELVLALIALAGLVVFVVVGSPGVNLDTLNAYSGGEILPNGLAGLWATLPLAAWFFFAIEGLPMASEEAKNPVRDIPRAFAWSFVTLFVIGVLTLTVAAGLGDDELPAAGAPLADAIGNFLGAGHWLVGLLSIVGLIALAGSFHALLLAYSRQTLALARARYLPDFLGRLNSRRVPVWAIVLPGTLSFLLAVAGVTVLESAVPVLVTTSVFAAAVSYVLMAVSLLIIRAKRPDLPRPFRAPGGLFSIWTTIVLAAILIPAGMAGYPSAVVLGVAVFAGFVAVYAFYSRHRIGTMTVEEELAAVQEAESAAG